MATAGPCSSCPGATEVGPNRLAVNASEPEDYERFGLSSSSIAPWEDGARTDNSPGSYEWWYFDTHLADGAKLLLLHGAEDDNVHMVHSMQLLSELTKQEKSSKGKTDGHRK